jgi:hypothetical protein
VIASTAAQAGTPQDASIGGNRGCLMGENTKTTRRRYESSDYRKEKLVAAAWLMLFAMLVGGSIYNKLGRPSLDASTPAVADVGADARPETSGSRTNRSR